MFNKRKLIVMIVSYLLLISFSLGIIFTQPSDKKFPDSGRYKLVNEIENASSLSKNNSESVAYLLQEQKKIVNISNPDNFNLIDTEFQLKNKEFETKLSIETLNFLYNIDLDNVPIEEEKHYVSPTELNGDNFILICYHQPITSFDKLKSYYKVYLNDKHVGNTNKGAWNKHYKFFSTRLESNKEYKIKLTKMVGQQGSERYGEALNFYQPDEYLEGVNLINDTVDKVIFLLMVWRKTEEMYEAVILAEEKGDKYLSKKGTLWKKINELYLNKQ